MTFAWGDPTVSNFSPADWTTEVTRIGASTLSVGDVVLVQAKTPGMFYNGKYQHQHATPQVAGQSVFDYGAWPDHAHGHAHCVVCLGIRARYVV